MPATQYDHTTASYRIRCLGCGTEVRTHSPYVRTALTTEGEDVSQFFPWVNRDGNFSTRCRECTRQRARASRPRSTRSTSRSAFRRLGLGRRFGIEMELVFPRGTDRYDISAALTDAGLEGWRVKSDGSLAGNGWEVVSPVLEGEDGIEQIRRACRVMRTLGADVNRSCGMHVHHEIRDLTVSQVKRVYHMWRVNQPLVDGLVSESRRGGRNTYCRQVNSMMADVERITRLSEFGHFDRYRTLNLAAYGRYGTIEIRQHQGTCDPEKVVSWLRFGQAVIETAAASTDEQASTVHGTLRSWFDRMGEALDETARTYLTGRAVQFGAVTV